LKNNLQVDFKRIRPLIDGSKETIDALQKYAESDPRDFNTHLYYFYILASHPENPKKCVKPRGKQKYDLPESEITEIKRIARWVYIPISDIMKNHIRDKKKAFEISIDVVRKILSKKYNLDLPEGRSFYNNWISDKRIKLSELKKDIRDAAIETYLIPQDVIALTQEALKIISQTKYQ
jgi:hypothetical protein